MLKLTATIDQVDLRPVPKGAKKLPPLPNVEIVPGPFAGCAGATMKIRVGVAEIVVRCEDMERAAKHMRSLMVSLEPDDELPF